MSNHLRWDGLDELKQWLRNLPQDLTEEANFIVNAAANEAARRIVDRYPSGKDADLKDRVSVKPMRTAPGGRFGVGVVVISASKIAFIYENGTEVRHTALGYNRGRVPPHHVVVQEVTAKRREMYRKLTAMLERKGLRVSGTP